MPKFCSTPNCTERLVTGAEHETGVCAPCRFGRRMGIEHIDALCEALEVEEAIACLDRFNQAARRIDQLGGGQ